VKPVRTVIMAKAPLAGLAKTRLIPALGADGAAKLAEAMLLKTLRVALAAGVGPVELCTSPAVDTASWKHVALPEGIICSGQSQGDLGARMAHLALRTITAGERLILIGTDCIELSDIHLQQTAEALRQYDVVMHPVADGGYALLGLNLFDGSLFSDVPWSTHTVARLTRQRIENLGWRLFEGELLHDVDTPEDLSNWAQHCIQYPPAPDTRYGQILQEICEKIAVVNEVIAQSTVTCPACGYRKKETMPIDACQWFYACESCHVLLKPKAGDCCVFCSYGDVACPPIQQNHRCCK